MDEPYSTDIDWTVATPLKKECEEFCYFLLLKHFDILLDNTSFCDIPGGQMQYVHEQYAHASLAGTPTA